MPKHNVMFCRFPGGNVEHPDTTDWLVKAVITAKADPRIGQVQNWRISDTPITMGRNRAIEMARGAGADLVVMVDADMSPDLYLGKDPHAKPFFQTALDFLLAQNEPCMVGVPYCGPPPHENVYVFRWASYQSDHHNADVRLEQFSREDAAERHGIEEVAALPTGLVMFDMRAIERLQSPYFYYEWKDGTESEKASTEDVTFTRDLSMQGVPLYCLWDCWAGHWKLKCVGRPHLLRRQDVSERFHQTVLRNRQLDLNGEASHERANGQPTDRRHCYPVGVPADLAIPGLGHGGDPTGRCYPDDMVFGNQADDQFPF